MNRRQILKSTGLLGSALAATACSSDPSPFSINPAQAQTAQAPGFQRILLEPDFSQTLSAVVLEPSFGPVPYLASDANLHLTYEIAVTNITANKIRVDKIEVLDDANRNRVLRTIEGDQVLNVMTLLVVAADVNQLESSQAGTLYLDVWFPPAQSTPAIIVHRISCTDLITGLPLDLILGARMQVRSDIVPPLLHPPAGGSGWVCAEACCGRSHHRRTPICINGVNYLSQRYAIDFVKLVNGQIFSGDPFVLSNWFVYGVELLAVADGVVVSTANDQQEWPIGVFGVKTLNGAAGNYVLVDMGNGMSYVFAHMQPGSVRVKAGDRVAAGQILGLAGNSGATGAPHLHMHIVSGRDIFQSQGIPWLFTSYTVTGYFPTIADLVPEDLSPPTNRVDVTPYQARNAYPQELRIINF